MKLYKQINNLKIYNLNNGGWIIKTPKGKELQFFAMKHESEEYCYQNMDFVPKKKKQWDINFQKEKEKIEK